MGTVVLATALAGCREQWHSELVSVNAAGTDSGNGSTPYGVVSPDGTKVAFATLGSDFGPVDTNGMSDVYVRDLATGVTTLVSANANGTNGGNHVSSIPIFTPDGTKVVFYSYASDLGPTDSNGTSDIYIRDLDAGTTDLVSVNHAGIDTALGSGADNARVSAEGTKVIFRGSGDYTAGDVGGSQIYVRDLVAGVTTRATVAAPGATGGPGGLAEAEISPDGTKVAFVSEASFVAADTNLRRDVYLRDLVAGTTTLVSRNASGTNGANDGSEQPVFSPDGTKLAFTTHGTDLGLPDEGFAADLLVRDMATNTTTFATVDLTGGAGNCDARDARFSPDSSRIAFSCAAGDLVASDTNRAFDVYVRDLVTETTELVSVNADGTDSGNRGSAGVWWNESGTRIVFASWATDLGPNDTHVGRDVYVRDLASDTTSLVSANADGSDTANLESLPLGFANGKVLFWTGANDLGPPDTNGQPDLYLASVVPPD